jgi:hypothetical protein
MPRPPVRRIRPGSKHYARRPQSREERRDAYLSVKQSQRITRQEERDRRAFLLMLLWLAPLLLLGALHFWYAAELEVKVIVAGFTLIAFGIAWMRKRQRPQPP